MIPLRDDNPTTLRPIVAVVLIALCVGAFLWQLTLGERGFAGAIRALGLVPAHLLGATSPAEAIAGIPAGITLFTSMFLHGGWMHLIGNMLYLWIFGNNVEDSMGHGRFLLFYLLCGVAAALAQALPNPDSTIPMVGASGAISGVLGAYLLLFPHARVLVLLPLGFYARLVQLPAMWVLGFWFVLQIINSVMTAADRGGVAWGAHIGGFVAGALLIPLFKRRGVRLFAPGHRHD
jgi:membrane associated rhomboid family serine protease